jgi:hypothetical protein
MSLGSVLVDRANLIRSEPTEEVIEGSVVFTEGEDAEGPEFRARLQISQSPERTKEGMTQADPRPMLLTERKDLEGNDLDFRTSDKIRVVSKELGTATWEVDGEPEPLRKKRTIIGWQLQIHKVDEG